MSNKIKSGFFSVAIFIASSPSFASNVEYPSFCKLYVKMSTIGFSSSTTRIVF